MKQSGAKSKYIIGVSILAACCFLAVKYRGYIPGTLRVDEQGYVFGTGKRQVFYESGKLLGEEHYVAGVPTRTITYDLDGFVIGSTIWDQKLGGMGYGVDSETGNIKMWFQTKYDADTRTFLAHGKAVIFNNDGSLKRLAIYKDGEEQSIVSNSGQ